MHIEGKPFWIAAGLILLLALVLRTGGLARDFPAVFHCDVPKQLEVIKSQVETGSFYNKNAGYPIGHQQVTYLLMMAEKKVKTWLELDPGFSDHDYYLTARVVGILFGLFGVLGLILAGRRLMGPGAGLLAGLLLALDEFHLVHSHHAMGDIPQTAMVILAFWACTRVMQQNRSGDSLMAGLFIGMAVAIKYYGGFMGLPFLLAHLLASKKNWPALALGILAGVAGFLILTPSFFHDTNFWFEKFYSEYLVQSKTSALSGRYPWQDFIKGYAISWNQWRESSLILPYLLPPSLALILLSRKRGDWLLLSALLPVIFIINVLRVINLKDSDQIVQVGFICLAVVRGLDLARLRLSRLPRAAMAAGMVLLMGLQFWHTYELHYTLRLPDTRILAARWLDHRLPPAPAEMKAGLDLYPMEATTIGGHLDLYDLGKGYGHLFIDEQSPEQYKQFLRSEAGRDLGYLILNSIAAGGLLDRLRLEEPAIKEFKFMPRSWQNPTLQIRDPNRLSFKVPFEPLYLYAPGWNTTDFVNTPYSMREQRQTVLEAGDHEFMIFSENPLDRMAFLIRGNGRVLIRHGDREQTLDAAPYATQILDFKAKSGFPYFTHSYSVKVRAKGRFMLSMAVSLPGQGAAYYTAGQKEQARLRWENARSLGMALLPQHSLRLAALYAGQGQPQKADETLADLERDYPGFRQAVEQVSRAASLEDALQTLSRYFKVPPRVLSWQSLDQRLSDSAGSEGQTVLDRSLGREVLEVPAGKPSWSKFWTAPIISQEWLRARFWLKAEPGPSEELGKVDLFAHVNKEPQGELGGAPIISSGGPDYFPVDLRLRAKDLPACLEFRVWSNGKRKLWLDRVELRPDLAAWAADLLKTP